MHDDLTLSTWHHNPLGQRVFRSDPPYFSISRSVIREGSDERRRHALANLAGLSLPA